MTRKHEVALWGLPQFPLPEHLCLSDALSWDLSQMLIWCAAQNESNRHGKRGRPSPTRFILGLGQIQKTPERPQCEVVLGAHSLSLPVEHRVRTRAHTAVVCAHWGGHTFAPSELGWNVYAVSWSHGIPLGTGANPDIPSSAARLCVRWSLFCFLPCMPFCCRKIRSYGLSPGFCNSCEVT